jgi:hypothetical protein
MRLLIAEKPNFAKDIIRYGLIPKDTDIVCTYGAGLWQYKMENISFDEIPFTTPPQKLTSRMGSYYPRKILYKENGDTFVFKDENITKSEENETLDKLIQTINNRLYLYEEIVVFVDPDRTGVWAAKQVIDKIINKKNIPINVIIIKNSLSEEGITMSFHDRVNNSWHESKFIKEKIIEQDVKTTFDYWWNVNSTLVLSELCKWVGLKSNTIISKYELMLIWIVASKKEPISKGAMLSIMRNWKGTGKYETKDDYCYVLGSPMSVSTIIENTINRGAVKYSEEDKTYQISEIGKSFVARLHKKTIDYDFPFRLEEWIQDGNMDACKQYIRTIFGRQLRFQRNQIKCWGVVPSLIEQLRYQHNIIAIVSNKDIPPNECRDEFILSSHDGKHKGVLKVYVMLIGIYRASISFNNKVIDDGISEFCDSELRTIGCMEFIKKSGVLWPQEIDDNDCIEF